MPGPNNVYKPKMAGFLIATIALVMVVIVILIATILIVAAGGDSSVTTAATDGNSPTHAWDTTVTTPMPIIPATTPVTTAPDTPANPSEVIIPGADTLEMDVSKVGQGALVLIDKTHFYTREGLVARKEINATVASILGFSKISSSQSYKLSTTPLYLDSTTVEAFRDMMDDLYEVTGTGVVQIRNAYYYNADLNAVTDQDSLEAVEHSTGYVVDLEINDDGLYALNHTNYKENYYNWLVENCWKYGFIHLRDTSKYSTFRYVGIAHAAALHNEPTLSFETYLTSLTAYEFDGDKKKVIDSNGNEWWIYYVKPEDGARSVYVPVLGDPEHYQVSGDNKGGFIVAVNTAQFAK